MALDREEENLLIEELEDVPWRSLFVQKVNDDTGKKSHLSADKTYASSSSGSSASYEEYSSSSANTTLLFKSKFFGKSYSIIITDGITVWASRVNAKRMAEYKIRFNPQLETPVTTISTMLETHLIANSEASHTEKESNDRSSHFELETAEKAITLRFYTKINFYQFKWIFHCRLLAHRSHSDFLKGHLLAPLMVMNVELANQVEELKALLAAKDDEISELKSRGAKLPKGHPPSHVFMADDFLASRFESNSFRDLKKQPRLVANPLILELYKNMFAGSQEVGISKKSTTQSHSQNPKNTLQTQTVPTESARLSPALSDDDADEELEKTKSVPLWYHPPPQEEDDPEIQDATKSKVVPIKRQYSIESAEELKRREAIAKLIEKKMEKKQLKNKKKKMKFV